MTSQLKGIKLSLLIHSTVFAAIALLGFHAGPAGKQLIIDFNLIQGKVGIPKHEGKATVAKKTINQWMEGKPSKRSKATKAIKESQPPPRIEPKPEQGELQVPAEAPEPFEEQVVEPYAAVKDAPNDDLSPMTGTDKVPDIAGDSPAGRGSRGRDFIYIRELVQRNISYPRIAKRMGLEGKVIISFIICSSGDVKEVEVVESSGSPILDKNAVEAVKKTSPFPGHQLEAKVIIPILYKLYEVN
jgi:protein TonB